jgi:hypothetical protein
MTLPGDRYARTLDATFCAHGCPVDSRPCEVVGAFSNLFRAELRSRTDGGSASDEPITGAAAQEGYEDLVSRATAEVVRELPCERCRSVEAQVERLNRLGRLERTILLAAPAPEESPAVIDPALPGRAAASAHQRAMRSLARAGLLQLGWSGVEVKADSSPWPRRIRKRSVRLSPLGHAVVQRLGGDLEGTRRIRWTRHRAALIAAVRLPLSQLPSLVHDRIAARVQHTLEFAETMEVFGRHEDAGAARNDAAMMSTPSRELERRLRGGGELGD